jgi:ferredoxin
MWRDKIYDAQPYLTNVYPGNTREINVIYALKDYTIEYFNLGVRPIDRFVYEVGSGKAKPKGYQITDACIGCGTCISECPEDAISEGEPYVINPTHCLHCGRCYELCPNNAIIRL